MSPRSRMLEILAAANLAPQQLAMTQANAQRDVANTQALAGLAPLLVNTATQGIGTYQKSVADDADTAARKAALDQLSTTGEHALLPGAEYGAQPDMRDPTAYAQSPADVAKQAVDSNKDLNPEKPTGFFDSIGNLLGDKEAVLAKARVNAQGLITNEVQSNRDKATALARQQQLDAQNAQRFQWEHEDRAAKAGASGLEAQKTQQELVDKKNKDAEDYVRPIAADAFRRGHTNDQMVGDIIAAMPAVAGIDPQRVRAVVIDEHAKQQARDLDNQAKGLGITNAQNEASLFPTNKALKEAQTTEAYANAGAAAAMGPTGKIEDKLREELDARPAVKEFNAARTNLAKMQGAAKDVSPAGDMSLIYSFMKLQDPGSTVREGEFANAQNAGNVSDKITNIYNKVISGERLSPEQRADFLGQAKNFYDANKAAYDAEVKRFTAIAASRGASPSNILPIALPPGSTVQRTTTSGFDPAYDPFGRSSQ